MYQDEGNIGEFEINHQAWEGSFLWWVVPLMEIILRIWRKGFGRQEADL